MHTGKPQETIKQCKYKEMVGVVLDDDVLTFTPTGMLSSAAMKVKVSK
jgi:hypothetical protein